MTPMPMLAVVIKFKRSDLISLLRDGDSVPVQVTGKVGSMLFEGLDVISG